MRSVRFDPEAWEDFLFWLATDHKIARRNRNQSRVSCRDEHRLMYRAGDDELKILKARYHY